MKSTLIVVGRPITNLYAAAENNYAMRISRYMPFAIKPVPDAWRTDTTEKKKKREGEHILASVTPADHVVLLDERGTERSSVDFAAWLEHMFMTTRNLVFVIGGPYGFDDSVYARADELVSLSHMTLPHDLARLVFLEQLYRACTIIKGEPYHHV